MQTASWQTGLAKHTFLSAVNINQFSVSVRGVDIQQSSVVYFYTKVVNFLKQSPCIRASGSVLAWNKHPADPRPSQLRHKRCVAAYLIVCRCSPALARRPPGTVPSPTVDRRLQALTQTDDTPTDAPKTNNPTQHGPVTTVRPREEVAQNPGVPESIWQHMAAGS